MHRIIVEAGPKKRKLGGELSVRVKYSGEEKERRSLFHTGCALQVNVGISFCFFA